MGDVIGIGENFKEVAEVKAHLAAQQKVITNLSKQIQEKDKEIAHLKDLLEKSTPILNTDPSYSVATEGLLTSDEEVIIRTQLRLLKQQAMTDQLTLEETKKFEIYNKALIQMRNQPQKIVMETKRLSDVELLTSLNNIDDKKDE